MGMTPVRFGIDQVSESSASPGFAKTMQALIMEEADGNGNVGEIMIADWVDVELDITLDSGCCDHIVDLADAPGYNAVLEPSPGSLRKQGFVVGNGSRVPNQGQVRLCMGSKEENGIGMQSIFQVAEITRPLMSVSRICDQDMVCIFAKDHARVENAEGKTVARFERDGGLYTCTMRLKRPSTTSNGQGFTRPER